MKMMYRFGSWLGLLLIGVMRIVCCSWVVVLKCRIML